MTDQTIPVESTTVEYAPSSPQTVFTIPFQFFADADIKVTKEDPPGTLVDFAIITDFTVQGTPIDGGFDGGTITLVTSITTPVKLKIFREVAIDRATNFPSTGPFDIDALNVQLNKLTAIEQQILNEVDNHFMSIPSNSIAATPWDAELRPMINIIEDPAATPDPTSITSRAWQLANLGGLLQAASAAEIDADLIGKYMAADEFALSAHYGFESGSFTPAWSGFSVDPSGADVDWVRMGNIVYLRIDSAVGTSNATTMTITNLPANLRPVTGNRQIFVIGGMVDNGAEVDKACMVNIDNGPTITFGLGFNNSGGGGWNSSATNKGFGPGTGARKQRLMYFINRQ